MSQQYCNQCENHCPVDALKCGRGRRAFGQESEAQPNEHRRGEGHGRGHHEPLPGVLGQLQQCGHRLHHSGAPENALSTLTPAEQAQLSALLTKLLNSWN